MGPGVGCDDGDGAGGLGCGGGGCDGAGGLVWPLTLARTTAGNPPVYKYKLVISR